MTISPNYGRQSLSAFWLSGHQGVRIPLDLGIVSLWSGLGLVLNAVVCTLGLGPEVAQLLPPAG